MQKHLNYGSPCCNVALTAFAVNMVTPLLDSTLLLTIRQSSLFGRTIYKKGVSIRSTVLPTTIHV